MQYGSEASRHLIDEAPPLFLSENFPAKHPCDWERPPRFPSGLFVFTQDHLFVHEKSSDTS